MTAAARKTAYLYVVTRSDLAAADLTVQVAHAVIEAGAAFIAFDEIHPHLVVCAVADERALQVVYNKLRAVGVPCVGWREDDMGNSLTAVATSPLRGKAREPLRQLPLWKAEAEQAGPAVAA